MVSLWEIAIKKNIGCLSLPDDFFEKINLNSGFERLSMQPAHLSAYLKLPLHHRDPFDRMLIAQAQEEGLTLVTMDVAIFQYEVSLLKV